VLWLTYRRCRINGGAPGVDGQTFEQIDEYGVQQQYGSANPISVSRRPDYAEGESELHGVPPGLHHAER
jgi:hypothetical protein